MSIDPKVYTFQKNKLQFIVKFYQFKQTEESLPLWPKRLRKVHKPEQCLKYNKIKKEHDKLNIKRTSELFCFKINCMFNKEEKTKQKNTI